MKVLSLIPARKPMAREYVDEVFPELAGYGGIQEKVTKMVADHSKDLLDCFAELLQEHRDGAGNINTDRVDNILDRLTSLRGKL